MAAAAATWRYRGDPEGEQPAVLVRFSNGRLRRPDSMRFTVYRNRDMAHPRKKHRRILVSETERLSYVGNNFGSGVPKHNSLCRYFVGVLDKDSGQMEVYNAEIFNMQPLLSDNLIPHDTKDYQNKSYREKMDLCIEAFGTSKQKRALNSRRMNAVGNDILNTAVTKAAANIIDAKGVTALIQDVAQDDVQNISIFLPPCNEDADKPENVYKFEDILSPAEYEALRVPAAVFINITAEEITKKTEEKSHCSFVLEELKFLPADEKRRDHKARCLWFLDTLIKFSYLKVIKKKLLSQEAGNYQRSPSSSLHNPGARGIQNRRMVGVARDLRGSPSPTPLPKQVHQEQVGQERIQADPMGPECPHIISRKLMKNFTSLTYNNGSIQNLVSASMKAKITAYVIALALHINNFQTDLTILQNDMKLQESRMMDIAKAMRLKVSKAKGLPGLEDDQNHKLGTLSLPLPVQKASGNQRKRRKMN